VQDLYVRGPETARDYKFSIHDVQGGKGNRKICELFFLINQYVRKMASKMWGAPSWEAGAGYSGKIIIIKLN
jgi:hypothetical protein